MAIGPFLSRLQQFAGVKGFDYNRIVDLINSIVDYSGVFSLQPSNGHLAITGSVPVLGSLRTGIASQSITGTDSVHIVTVTTTGSPPSPGGSVFVVTFANTWSATPVLIGSVDSGPPAWGVFNPSSASGYTFIHGGTNAGASALAASTTYKYGIIAIGAGSA